MKTQARLVAHALLLVLGIVLMAWGIGATKYGAAGIGLIVAAVNVQQLLKKKKVTTGERIGHGP